MPINQVQFQRGLAMAEFMGRYGTQELCHAALVESRCPLCQYDLRHLPPRDQ